MSPDIHVRDETTSAASGRPGRLSEYPLSSHEEQRGSACRLYGEKGAGRMRTLAEEDQRP
jgi:hypothetical protein